MASSKRGDHVATFGVGIRIRNGVRPLPGVCVRIGPVPLYRGLGHPLSRALPVFHFPTRLGSILRPHLLYVSPLGQFPTNQKPHTFAPSFVGNFGCEPLSRFSIALRQAHSLFKPVTATLVRLAKPHAEISWFQVISSDRTSFLGQVVAVVKT